MLILVKRLARRLLPDRVYRKYRKERVRLLLSRYAPRVVEHTYGGIPLEIWLADPLGEGWYDHDWPEPAEIAAVRDHGLAPGSCVFDLGAHQCVVALMLARHVAPAGRVIAVEAEPHNVRVAQRNISLNHVENVVVVSAAVADSSGEVLFAKELNGRVDPGHPWGKTLVPATTIDALAERYGKPDFVLVDIEGFEGTALAGAKQTLASGATFVVELHVGCGLEDAGGTAEDVVETFHAAGYALQVCSGQADGNQNWKPLSAPPRERAFVLATR